MGPTAIGRPRMAGADRKIFLIVDRGSAHRARKTRDFVDSLDGALSLFFLPPYSPDLNPDELVGNHVKTNSVGRTATIDKQSFKRTVRAALRSLQMAPKQIQSFFHKPSLRYAA